MQLQQNQQNTDSGGALASSTTTQLSKDDLFEILKNQRRRDALTYLKEHGGTATLSDLSEYIAAKENGIAVNELSSSQRKRVYIGLYQCHLPKMANVGVIDFDKDRGNIALRPEASLLDQYLDSESSGIVQPVSTPLLATMLVTALLVISVAASLVGIQPFASLPGSGWAVVSTFALLVVVARDVYAR